MQLVDCEFTCTRVGGADAGSGHIAEGWQSATRRLRQCKGCESHTYFFISNTQTVLK